MQEILHWRSPFHFRYYLHTVCVLAMSPTILEKFPEPQRSTSLPYLDWLTGERMLLTKGEDFTGDARKVISKVYAYARRRNWAVIAVLAKSPTDPPKGPKRHIHIWGDTSRPYGHGVPDEIRLELGQGPRRKRPVSD